VGSGDPVVIRLTNMQQKSVPAEGVRFSVTREGREVGRAFLYLMHNELHDEPFGLMEDVFVDESQRGTGIGTELVQAVVESAKARGCYKLIATSRSSRQRVHELYRRLGFEEHGVGFRLNFGQDAG
jgi:GNAT superfamily N-acetyltransferase